MAARSKAWVTRFLELPIRIPPKARISVPCECCVFLGSLYEQPIPRPEES